MRPVTRVLAASSIATVGALGPVVAAHAAGSGSITTAPSAEGWYQVAPVCALPTGCPLPPASPYAPNTLHVGVALGGEESRTTLQLDLSAIPPGAKPAGGQLRLPVATGPRDGSRAPGTAKLRACLVAEPVEDVEGSFAAPPEADCETASADAVFEPAAGQAPAAFTVDLASLAEAWQTSAAPGALTLVPGDVAPGDNWHVALSDRDREGEGVARITAAVSFVSSVVDVTAQPPPFVPAPLDSGFSAPSFTPAEPGFALPPPVAPEFEAALPVPAGPAQQQAAPAPQAAPAQAVPVAAGTFLDTGFRYPAVFLLPLAFALAVGWLGRALTRDLAADPAS